MDKVTLNGQDVTGRVQSMRRLGPLARAFVLDANPDGSFRVESRRGRPELAGRWRWGIVRVRREGEGDGAR